MDMMLVDDGLGVAEVVIESSPPEHSTPEVPPDQPEADENADRQLKIAKLADDLLHASSCGSPLESSGGTIICESVKCKKMRRLLYHNRMCKKDVCQTCKCLAALCVFHGKRCRDMSCSVPFCPLIQLRLRLQEMQKMLLLKQQVIQRRRRNRLMHILSTGGG